MSQRISKELFDFIKGALVLHEVENEHLGPMGAKYKTTYECCDGFFVYESGAMGGCDYYIEDKR